MVISWCLEILRTQVPTYLFSYLLLSPSRAAASSAGGLSLSHLDCKAVPGTPSWPSADAWSRLNESTGGRLFQPTPPGAVCHPGQPTYDAAQCAAVQSGWRVYDFHAADPVSSDWNQWNNDTCLANASDPCSGAGYPVFVINATTTQHVKAGVDFARRHNVRLIVKSSGHDYLGRSSAPNSLSIWTHHLRGIELHDNFKPKCCNAYLNTTAVTAAGGEYMINLYQATDAANLTVVGGGGKTVSLGGYLTGGGHSLLSSTYGLATDQVLEMEIVTPKGQILTLNECKNQDLFWAMRGGGGSTFGVLTSVTIKTHPSPPIVALDVAWASAPSNPTIYDAAAYTTSQFPSLMDEGLTGYTYIFDDYPNPFDGGQTRVSGMFGTVALLGTSDPNDMLKLWTPILEHINTTWQGYQFIIQPSVYTSFLDWYNTHYDTSAAGTDMLVGSWLVDRPSFTGNQTALKSALQQFTAGGVSTIYMVAGEGVQNAQPRGGSDAVNPAWRKAMAHCTVPANFPPLNATAKAEAFANLDYYVDALRKLDPTSGAYVNEANPQEPNWQHAFWGDNYVRLLKIKREVDPDDVLWCHPCVGSEGWEVVGDQLCRV